MIPCYRPRELHWSPLEKVGCQLIELLMPGFAVKPGKELHKQVILLAQQAAGLTNDAYARSKAEGVIRWASAALSPQEGQSWQRVDAEAFAMEEAWRLLRQARALERADRSNAELPGQNGERSKSLAGLV